MTKYTMPEFDPYTGDKNPYYNDVLEINHEPIFIKIGYKGYYNNHEFILTDYGNEIFVTFFDWMDIDSSDHAGIIEAIKKSYLNKKK